MILTTEAADQIAVLLATALTYREIAEQTGYSVHTVANVAKARGLKRGKGRRDTGPRSPHRDRARELRSLGQSNTAIGAELGITRQAVSRLLR